MVAGFTGAESIGHEYVQPEDGRAVSRRGRGAARIFGQYGITLWVAITLNFALPRLAPAIRWSLSIGAEAGTLLPAQRAALRRELGLDQSLPVQYVRYLRGIASADLGTSIRYAKPVTGILVERVGWTLLLMAPALLIGVTLGTALGAIAAWRRGARSDVALVVGVLALDSLPVFWIGMVLIAVFAGTLGWLPAFGVLSLQEDGAFLTILRRTILPVTTLTIAGVGRTLPGGARRDAHCARRGLCRVCGGARCARTHRRVSPCVAQRASPHLYQRRTGHRRDGERRRARASKHCLHGPELDG